MPRKLSREAYNEYMRVYMGERYQRRKAEALAALGGKCSVTGCESTDALQFDHIDPRSKYKVIARIWSYSETRFWDEVAKCQLLCHDCHLTKTLAEKGQHRAKGVHGTVTNYITYKCRCDLCRAAVREKSRVYKRKRRERVAQLEAQRILTP